MSCVVLLLKYCLRSLACVRRFISAYQQVWQWILAVRLLFANTASTDERSLFLATCLLSSTHAETQSPWPFLIWDESHNSVVITIMAIKQNYLEQIKQWCFSLLFFPTLDLSVILVKLDWNVPGTCLFLWIFEWKIDILIFWIIKKRHIRYIILNVIVCL